MAFDYTGYAHSQGFYALRGKGAEFKKLAEELFYIEGAIRYQSLLEINLGKEEYHESDLLKSHFAEKARIIEELTKVCKPRKDQPA